MKTFGNVWQLVILNSTVTRMIKVDQWKNQWEWTMGISNFLEEVVVVTSIRKNLLKEKD